MKHAIRVGKLRWLLLMGVALLLSSGCVMQTEYLRMQRALGAEIIELRQGKKLNAKQVKALQQKVSALEAQSKRDKASVTALDKKFKDAMKGQKTLEERIRKLLLQKKLKDAEIGKCGQMLKGRGKQLFDLQTKLAKKEQELKEKQSQFDKKQATFKKKNDKLLAEIKQKQLALKASLERVRRLEKQINALKKIYTELTTRLRSLVKAGKLKIQMIRGLLVLQLPEKILFSSGRATVKSEGRRAITKVAQILKTLKYRWQVVGHTDSRGSASFNWKLSSRRALAVLFVMLKAGMPAEQMSFGGFGQYQPTAGNDTSANRSLNRRTELVLVPDLSDIYSAVGTESKPPKKE
jgi:chemotaxis protein MotB